MATCIELDREVLEAETLIALGNLVPRISAGWGGGAKMTLPGFCGQRTTDMMLPFACTVQPVPKVIRALDNQPRRETEFIAGKAGLDFIGNRVLDQDHNILGVFASHSVETHRRGVKLAKAPMTAPIPRQADVLNPNLDNYAAYSLRQRAAGLPAGVIRGCAARRQV